MPAKDHHGKPYDETTITKLEIFEEYAQAWIPTFVMSGHREICIFDLFAGTGKDQNGISGSPIRLLQQIGKFIGDISEKNCKVKLYLNEYKPKKYALLQAACAEYLAEHPDVARAVEVIYSNEEFDVCFNRLLPEIKRCPSLVYLDQCGVKFLANKYLSELEKSTRTDFLYFVSSSYFLRFGDSEEFKRYVNFDKEQAKKDPYRFIHRNLLDQLKQGLLVDSGLKLYPFSLRKGSNIHGIIFGATSPRAVDKFLDIAWKRAPLSGDADFDIDEEHKKSQLDMFSGLKQTKIQVFQSALEDFLKEKGEATNADIFLFTLDKGHPKSHASEYLRTLKKLDKVHYEGRSPKINYDAVKDRSNEVKIKWNK